MSAQVLQLRPRVTEEQRADREARNIRVKLLALSAELERVTTLGNADAARACADLASKLEAVVGRVEALGGGYRERAESESDESNE